MQAQVQTHASLKESLFKVIDEMQADKIAEVLDFALSINSRKQLESQIVVKRGSFKDLNSLIGIISIGGDALIDSENYWE